MKEHIHQETAQKINENLWKGCIKNNQIKNLKFKQIWI